MCGELPSRDPGGSAARHLLLEIDVGRDPVRVALQRERAVAEVREERSRSSRDFTNLLRVEAVSSGEALRVAGTTIGNDDRLWLVSALGFELEMELAPLLVIFRYDDVPGVIGKVGTLFGESGVNIANMAVSRTRQGGQALMALSIDSQAPEELVAKVHTEFDDARFISLE